MRVILVPPGMDLRELAQGFIDVAVFGSTVAVLTTRGVYVMHTDRVNRDLGEGSRAVVRKLAARGLPALQIAAMLGVSHHYVRQYHPGCVHDARRKVKERPSVPAAAQGQADQVREVQAAALVRGAPSSDPRDPRPDSESSSGDRRSASI